MIFTHSFLWAEGLWLRGWLPDNSRESWLQESLCERGILYGSR